VSAISIPALRQCDRGRRSPQAAGDLASAATLLASKAPTHIFADVVACGKKPRSRFARTSSSEPAREERRSASNGGDRNGHLLTGRGARFKSSPGGKAVAGEFKLKYFVSARSLLNKFGPASPKEKYRNTFEAAKSYNRHCPYSAIIDEIGRLGRTEAAGWGCG